MVRRAAFACCLGVMLQLGGCFPNYFFQNLLASSVSSVVSVVLTDAVNVLLPPPTT